MHKIIHTTLSPQPIGPYVQGILAKNILFISGQIALDQYSNIISQDISTQTKQVLSNIKNIIKHAGLKIHNIIKTTIFTTDLDKINEINKIYKTFFIKYEHMYPSRSCVEVSKLPNNAKIEIEAIAIKNN